MQTIQGSSKSINWSSPKVRAWIAITILALICVVLGKAAWGIYQKNEIAQANKISTLKRLDDLKSREKNVEQKLAKIRTQQGVEEEIRVALPVVKDGEHVITIIDKQDEALDQGATSTQKSSFWTALLRGL